ncbi:MAG: translocation/assembly module TamB domain-containing protein [Candidatus Aminicenantes bacterium]|nr:translocation/assembly module TamB domain-containing protein [Candidatus Aminicenantes bacterium]
MLLTTGFFFLHSRLKHEIAKINRELTSDIRLSDIKLQLFPPGLAVKNIKNFVIKNRNMVSFSKVNLEIPFTSIFAKEKQVNISIIDPKFVFEKDVFAVLGDIFKKRKGKGKGKSPVTINRITIKNGEISFSTDKLSINLLEFDLEHSFKTSDITLYRLKSPHLKVKFLIRKKTYVTLEGDLLAEIKQQRGSWKINRLLWNTEHIRITMNGRIFKDKTVSLNVSIQGSLKQVLDPLLKGLSIREFVYGNAKIMRDEKGEISVAGKIKAHTFSMGGEPFEQLRGNIAWDSISKKHRIDAFFRDDSFNSQVIVESKNKITDIQIKNASAYKAAKMVRISKTAPIGSVLSEGNVRIEKKKISGTVKLTQIETIADRQFNLAGPVDFTYIMDKSLKLKADNIVTEFGKCSLTADAVLGDNKKIILNVTADVNETGNIHKYSDYYIGLNLNTWKLKKGSGRVNLYLENKKNSLFSRTGFKIRNFTSTGQGIDSLEGFVVSENGVTTGSFEVKDETLSGKAESYSDKDINRIKFYDVSGESRKVLTILDFDIDLTGRMKGDFTFELRRGETYPLMRGRFTGEKVNFYDFEFDNVKGDLESRDYVSIKNLECLYKDGKGNANFFLNFYTNKFKINGTIDKIDINKMHGEFTGRGDISFSGEGSFGNEELLDNDPIHVTYKSGNAAFFKDHEFRVRGDAKIYTDFSGFIIKPGEKGGEIIYKTLPSHFTIEFNRVKERYSGNFTFNLQDINLLIPWGNNRGAMELKGQILGSETGNIRTEGYATFKGERLSFPSFPHTLDNFSGDLIFKDLDFTLRSLRGTLGGGEFESSGYLSIKNDKLEDFFLDFHGKDMLLYPMDRTSCRLNTRDLTLRYIKPEDKLLLSGVLNFPSSVWERELDEDISFGTASSLSTSGSEFIEMLKFDLKLIGRKNFQINNSLLKGKGKFDLKLTGTTGFPIVNGTIDFGEGYLEMSDNKFELIKAKARFKNNDASVDLESETFIKNYRIKFNVRGTLTRLKPEFQSNPPLPPRDILTLLSLGELFERPTTTELSSQIGAGTTGLIAQEITEQIKKRTKKIFGDYVLRINPNITGASVEGSSRSRVIVGKSIARDILIVYSTNFSTQRQEVVYVQYQLSPTVSLIGKRNENGRFSIDIRFRRRH